MEECQISKKEAATIVNLIFGKISEALAEGGRVEIRGLCSYSVRKRSGGSKNVSVFQMQK